MVNVRGLTSSRSRWPQIRPLPAAGQIVEYVLVAVVVVLDLSVRKPNRRIDDDEDEHENEKTRDFRIFLTVLVVVVVLGPSVRKANRGRRRDTIEDNGLVV
jgi:hypothetical protein